MRPKTSLPFPAMLRGSPIRLEANAVAGARRLAEEFARAKASQNDGRAMR